MAALALSTSAGAHSWGSRRAAGVAVLSADAIEAAGYGDTFREANASAAEFSRDQQDANDPAAEFAADGWGESSDQPVSDYEVSDGGWAKE